MNKIIVFLMSLSSLSCFGSENLKSPDYVECNDSRNYLRVVFNRDKISGKTSMKYTRSAFRPQEDRAVAAEGDEILLSNTPIGTLVTAEDKKFNSTAGKELVSFLMPKVNIDGIRTEAHFATSVFESSLEMQSQSEVIQNNFSFPVECKALLTN